MTFSARWSRLGSSKPIVFPFVWNSMFRSLSVLVRRCSPGLICRYSHDLHAKKKAPIASWAIAFCRVVTAAVTMVERTQLGRAFCCFFLGSSFRKALNCRCKIQEGSLSSSFVGFCRPFARKVETTCEMECLTVLSATVALIFLANLPLRKAMANAPTRWIRWDFVRSSRKGLCSSPMDLQYLVHLSHDRDRSSCVFRCTALLRAAAAAMRSPRR